MTKTEMNGVAESKAAFTRDEARAKIFASKKLKSETLDFFGVDIELRQPSLGSIIQAQQQENRQASIVQTLVDYAYIPNTDIKLFSEEDAASFMEMPFDKNFVRVTEALARLTEVDFRPQEGTAQAK